MKALRRQSILIPFWELKALSNLLGLRLDWISFFFTNFHIKKMKALRRQSIGFHFFSPIFILKK